MSGKSSSALLAEAAELAAEHSRLEAAALAGSEQVELHQMDHLRERSRLARWEAQVTARAEARAADERRAAELLELRSDAERLAAGIESVREAVGLRLGKIAELAGEVRVLGEGHNSGLAALAMRAAALGVTAATPSGPRSGDEGLALAGGSVIAGSLLIEPLGDLRSLAVAATQSGEVPEVPRPVRRRSEQARPHHLLVAARTGTLHATTGDLSRGFIDQLLKGDLIELDDTSVDAWMNGTLDVPAAVARVREGR